MRNPHRRSARIFREHLALSGSVPRARSEVLAAVTGGTPVSRPFDPQVRQRYTPEFGLRRSGVRPQLEVT